MGSLNSSLKVGSLIWFCLKLLKIRKSDDKICLFEKVGIGARLENIHTYKTIGSLVIGLCRFLRVTSRRLLSLVVLWRNKSYCINLLNLPVHLLKNLRPLFSQEVLLSSWNTYRTIFGKSLDQHCLNGPLGYHSC
ncbi:uncharacterized protein LOC125874893 isoform X3 [Solanum stenotomum]|uniref:uncharacterized protein LOC125874893 isoform X3 n=1 Tax=Solanum stenotomum TaxID=172797 RepID=UPI0020D1EF99|nr:uncharacterized protein LOC125874893 isoform X3 [Solanum stenotomum]